MKPQIGIGDVLFVKEAEQIEVGDIISYRLGDMTVTHRVIEIVQEEGGPKYRTKGDFNNTEDKELVAPGDVEGIVVFKIAKIGNAVMFLKTKIGIIILVAAAILFYKSNNIAEKRKENRKKKRLIYDLRMEKEEIENERKL